MKDYVPVVGVMELDGVPFVSHDDRLLIRSEKHQLGLRDTWKLGTRIAWKDGEPIIVRWHHRDDVSRTCSEPPAGEELLWRPQYERTVPMEGVRVRLLCNQCDVELIGLQNDLRSRYAIGLEVLTEMICRGVVKYTPRLSSPTERNIREAIRHRMRRYAKVTEYEHDLIFKGELGARMFDALRPHDKAPSPWPNTIYLKGYKRYPELTASVKFYNVSEKEKRADAPSETIWKLETTLHKEFFKAHGMRDVSQFLEQPDIQERLEEELSKHLCSVLKLLREGGVDVSQLELGVTESAPRLQARQILSRSLTLTERVKRLEEKTEEHAERLERIEEHLRQKRSVN